MKYERSVKERSWKEGGGKAVREGKVLDLAFDVNFAKGLSPRRLEG
jgi:hypothetical protein